MRMLALATVTLSLAVLGCDGDEEAGPVEEPSLQALHGVPLFRPALSMARRGSGGTVELVFHAGTTPDSVAGFYRRTLVADGWTIQGDVTAPDGTVTLHAERDGKPVWVLVKLRPGGQGTEFTLIGAEPDTTETSP
jgi:hypothetical protein